MKITTVIGARPQFIKAATVSRAFASKPSVTEIIIHTGQHFDQNMSDVFFGELNIPQPGFNLGISGGSHGEQTGQMMIELERTITNVNPDLVLVYGDTNSTLAAALVAAKLHIPVAHVEAGLRSFNKRMPEEINRILTDHVSDYLFIPTKTAAENLKNEGVQMNNVHFVGDVMFDAAMYYSALADNKEGLLSSVGLELGQEYALATIHRAENTNDKDRLRGIFEALNQISSELKIILPLHPRTRKFLQDYEMGTMNNNIILIDPISYLEMVYLEKNCKLILTDSGGVQKEAFFHQKPCVTLRDETEWVELVAMGVNGLAGADPGSILSLCSEFLDMDPNKFNARPYGEGNAAQKIADIIH